MMNCLVIDDDIGTALHICKYIERNEDLNLIGYETVPQIGLQKILDGALKADVLFLDILMDGMTGIEFALQIKNWKVKNKMHIVFITGDISYGHLAYDINIVDYLTKPITYQRFLQAVEKLKQLDIKNTLIDNNNPTHVGLAHGKKGQLIVVEREDIIFMMSASNYVHVYFTNREPLKLRSQLVNMEKTLLGGNFIRIHKSYIININKIKTIEGSVVKLANDCVAEIGEFYRDDFMARLGRMP